MLKILVYGAGNIGSLYAAKLKDAGNDVGILARGQRLCEIREHGIVLEDFHTREKTTTRVNALERLDPEDKYDLVLVVLPKCSVNEALPILSANRNTPSVMFFGNNAAGPDEMLDSIGRERVLLGFPGAAGVPHDEAIRYLILDRREQPTTIGELDGSESSRIKAIANALNSAAFPISICSNIDAWLKTHAAEIVPAAGALYMAECDIGKLKRNREALVMMIRAIREGYRVLSTLGVPITPSSHKIFRWIPEFLMVLAIRRKLDDGAWKIKTGHAAAARDEMMTIAGEFRELVQHSGVNTPAIHQLEAYLKDRDHFAHGECERSGKAMTFGERVRELRKMKGITLRELAPQVGVGFTYLSRVENGRLNSGDYPSETLIHRLACVLDTDENELLILSEKIPEIVKRRVFERPDEFRVLAELSDTQLKKLVAQVSESKGKRKG